MAQQTVVHTAAITRQARPVCDIAADIRAASQAWRQALADPAEALGLPDAASALIGVRDAWEDDFSVYREVLAQWCQAVQAAAAGYTTVDEYVATQQHAIPHQPPV
jgi:hypothetical protein